MDAAVRSGIPVDRHIIAIYILSAATSGIAGFLSTLRFTAGSAVIGDPLLLVLDRRGHHRRRQHVRRRRHGDRHGDRRAHHRGADDRARHAQRRGVLAVHRGRNGRHRRGADRPVARPHHRPRARRRFDDERAAALRPQPDQDLRRPRRGRQRELRRRARRGRRPARRQRRGQVDADQMRLRRPRRPEEGEIVFDGRPVAVRKPDGRAPRRDRDDLPGPRARQQSRRRRQHLPRPRGQDAPLRRARPDARRQAHARAIAPDARIRCRSAFPP